MLLGVHLINSNNNKVRFGIYLKSAVFTVNIKSMSKPILATNQKLRTCIFFTYQNTFYYLGHLIIKCNPLQGCR